MNPRSSGNGDGHVPDDRDGRVVYRGGSGPVDRHHDAVPVDDPCPCGCGCCGNGSGVDYPMRYLVGGDEGPPEPTTVDPEPDLGFRIFTWTVYVIITAVAAAGVVWLWRAIL